MLHYFTDFSIVLTLLYSEYDNGRREESKGRSQREDIPPFHPWCELKMKIGETKQQLLTILDQIDHWLESPVGRNDRVSLLHLWIISISICMSFFYSSIFPSLKSLMSVLGTHKTIKDYFPRLLHKLKTSLTKSSGRVCTYGQNGQRHTSVYRKLL